MIRQLGNTFVLDTNNTTYAFRVIKSGHLEHIYYGKKITIREEKDADCLQEQHQFAPGNTNNYDAESAHFSLEDICLEMSSYGKGDIREPFVEITHQDGSMTSDFIFRPEDKNASDKNTGDKNTDDKNAINKKNVLTEKGKKPFDTLPGSYAENEDDVEHLKITLHDSSYNLELELHYYVYENCDVITRSSKLINTSKETIFINRLMSMQLDFNTADYRVTSFHGAWAREMRRYDADLIAGKYVNESYTGSSSSRANPFVMLSKKNTTEDFGECFGFNLIYSGNHYEAFEVSGHKKTRVVTGINPTSFRFMVEPDNSFEAPEAVMTFSVNGFNGMSQNMHHFVKEHIVRGAWKNKTRPVLLNSWEAAYFDINEKKLLSLAKAGKEVGIELFVMDDGWFGSRDDDTQSLGDWFVNKKKLPNGLDGLGKQIKKLGLDFGIWVEPEMVNVKSELYKKHPEWVMQIKDKPHSEGRNQRILDLSQTEVQDYIIEEMSKVFSAADISYVKWDMNRTFTDYFSQALPAERQGEVAHRYMMGLYHCMDVLTKKFPKILFEGCAGGGNRFDLGILSYFPQIWASDDTDALCRAEIQTSYSYGYPMSTLGAHVSSCPNHQTLRTTPLNTRFNVAAFGVLGYECNLCDMKKEDLAAIKAQIELYKQWREVLQKGDFYRGRSFSEEGSGSVLSTTGNVTEWIVVSKDQNKAVGFLMQKIVSPNTQFEYFKARGLAENKKYHFYNLLIKHNVKEFGDLVNTVAPIHIKPDSAIHNLVAKFVKMDGETEDFFVYGDTLMNSGVKLSQAFAATGYSDSVRHFADFASRMYFFECSDS